MSKFQKGTVVFSFDDGRRDAFRLYDEVLKKYNLPATFNIVSGWVDHNNTGERSITINELKEMHQSPLIEIASHGFSHKNTDEDITKDKELLCAWLGIKDEKMGFASPGSALKNDYIIENEQHFKDLGFLYVRTGRTNLPLSQEQLTLQQELKSQGESDFLVEASAQLIKGFDNICVNSVPVLCHHTVEDLKKLISLAENQKACIVLMFHSVSKKGEYKPNDLWTYDFEKFLELAEYLAQKRENGEIEILTTREAFLKGE